MIEIKCLASGSSGNAYYITDDKTPLLLEAGIAWKQIRQGLNFQTSSLAGILITHSHKDHCKSAHDAIKAGIDTYMSDSTAQALGLSGHRVRLIQTKKQFRIGTWIVLPFELVHDIENMGFLLASGNDKLIYLTDTAYCRYKFAGLTHIMCEANYSLDILNENILSGEVPAEMKNRLLRTHFSLENVKGFLRANDLSKVQEIHLIHISEGNGDGERFKREVQALTGKPTCISR